MKSTTENTCKFITIPKDSLLTTINFVFETQPVRSDRLHIEDKHTIGLIVNGSGTLHLEHTTKKLVPGILFFTFAGIPYSIKGSDDLQYIYISFKGPRAQHLFHRLNISPSQCTFSGQENLISFWQNCLGKADDNNLDLLSESVLLYTLSRLTPPVDHKNTLPIGPILKYIDRHLTDTKLSLSTTAEALKYSPKYISSMFKKQVGLTFSEYVRNARIQHAIFLLEQGITSVKNVAFLCGYSDPFYFSNVFRQAVGVSPSDYVSIHDSKNECDSENSVE